MTLEEAIKHCEEKAIRECGKCGEDHKQLAEWLREYAELAKREEQKETYCCLNCKNVFDIYNDSVDSVDICPYCGNESPMHITKEMLQEVQG